MCNKRRGEAARRIIDRAARFAHDKAMRFQKRPQLPGGAESRGLPCRGAEPATDAPDRRPETPSTELADYEPATGSEAARHLSDGMIGPLDETEHCHGDDIVERSVRKGQCLGLSVYEIHLDRFRQGAVARGSEHPRVGIESRHPSATAR